jgi:multidrug efflux pump subunit AcrA (membrane-fusion protein)
VAVAVASFVPAEHSVEVRGSLQPRSARDVFAPVDGEVAEVRVHHQQDVAQDALLVALRSPSLELEHRRVVGERDATREKLQAVESARLIGGNPETPDRGGDRLASALSGSAEELRKQLESQEQQLAILNEQSRALRVRSPMAGAVLTWQIEDLLEGRPVQRGQVLATVADLAGAWELRLEVPDRRIGHVLAAQRELRPNLPVHFALATAPGRTFEGRIREVWPVAEPAANGGPATVRVLADFDRAELEQLRPGATVLAKIHCGRRPLGYVWFHGIFEAIQALWFF